MYRVVTGVASNGSFVDINDKNLGNVTMCRCMSIAVLCKN